jgi:alkylation response protein AidB-like acyl-CoA dehydrogenase
MNFDFPDDLKRLREEAQKFLRQKCPAGVPRRILDGGGTHDAALWSAIAEMGWLGASIPEEHGGSGLGPLAVCVLAEEIGYVLAPVPFAATVACATEALLLLGSAEQKSKWLPRIAAGRAIGTLALAERPGALVASRLTTEASDGRLSGTKIAVADGLIADFAVVAARDSRHGARLHLVELGGSGVTREAETTFDQTKGHATRAFTGAVAAPLGSGGVAEIERVLQRAAVLMAFEQLGVAQAALDQARAYALERYAFGRPIGSFQAIKHKLADMYVAVELARSNAYWGAWAISTDAAELPLAAATARISASDAGWLAAKENVQTHGGMGYTWDGDSHLYYRRAKLLSLTLGSPREWKRRLAHELKSRNSASTALME